MFIQQWFYYAFQYVQQIDILNMDMLHYIWQLANIFFPVSRGMKLTLTYEMPSFVQANQNALKKKLIQYCR